MATSNFHRGRKLRTWQFGSSFQSGGHKSPRWGEQKDSATAAAVSAASAVSACPIGQVLHERMQKLEAMSPPPLIILPAGAPETPWEVWRHRRQRPAKKAWKVGRGCSKSPSFALVVLGKTEPERKFLGKTRVYEPNGRAQRKVFLEPIQFVRRNWSDLGGFGHGGC